MCQILDTSPPQLSFRCAAHGNRPGAVALVIDDILDDDQTNPRADTMDVVMVAVAGGRERTVGELGEPFERAGFRPGAVTETGGITRVFEAAAV